MYVLFALLVSLLFYGIARLVLRLVGRGGRTPVVLTRVSMIAFFVLLVLFNLLSNAIGVDVGPFRSVSYSIPEDYTAQGLLGMAVLAVYALACIAPVFGFGAALRVQR